ADRGRFPAAFLDHQRSHMSTRVWAADLELHVRYLCPPNRLKPPVRSNALLDSFFTFTVFDDELGDSSGFPQQNDARYDIERISEYALSGEIQWRIHEPFG